MTDQSADDLASKTYRTYLYGLAAGFFFFMASVVTINLAYDPANLLLDDQIKAVAKLMEEGNYVSGISNLDMLALQSERISLLRRPPDTVVMGSSRAMVISSEIWPGNLKNHWVNGAGIFQFCQVVEGYASRSILPRRMVLVIDPWVFNANGQSAEATSLDEACRRFTPAGVKVVASSLDRQQTAKALAFVSLGYLKASIERARQYGVSSIAPYWRRLSVETAATSDPPLVRGGLAPEGYRIPPEAERTISEKKVAEAAKAFGLDNKAYNLGNFRELSPVYAQTLLNIIDYLQNAGIEVIIGLAPYHPLAIKNLAANPAYGPIITKAEDFLRKEGAARGIQVKGSYLSDICKGPEFFDPFHPRASCHLRIFRDASLKN